MGLPLLWVPWQGGNGVRLFGMGRESVPSQVDFYSGDIENIGDRDLNLKTLSPCAYSWDLPPALRAISSRASAHN